MAIRIITHEKTSTQQNITDYLGMPTFEEIDLRTPEGVQRYKERFGCQPNGEGTNYCIRRKSQKKPSESPLLDIEFLFSIYNERDRRLFAGFLAKAVGFRGIQKVARMTSLNEKTVRKGVMELNEREKCLGSRIRREGGGRPLKVRSEPRYEAELQDLIEDEVAGDPMNEKKWVRKTIRWMQENLNARGINVSLGTIWNTLKNLKISLKKNKKSTSAKDHPNRDEQFQYLNKVKHMALALGVLLISIDGKKKELIGNFKNDGMTWRMEAIEVLDHDFPSSAVGKLIPYGIYDLKNNNGHVYCGTTRDTSEFAVDCIYNWWVEFGRIAYPNQTEILILCDSGGSNSYRWRMWKWSIQTKLADGLGLTVFVCHYPSGASKYNPIEHKMFSFISKNWAGEPLTSYYKALSFIKTTKTEKGLEVGASLIEKEYKLGLKVSNEQMDSLSIKHARVCPQWNYCIKPR